MIRFNEESIRLEPQQSTTIVGFRGTTIIWETISVDSTKGWCQAHYEKLSPTEGEIVIQVTQNDGEDRTAIVNIIAEDTIDGEQTYSIEVNQEGLGQKPYFKLNPESVKISSAEQYVSVKVESDRVENVITVINNDWIKEVNKYKYKVDYNPRDQRVGTVTYTVYYSGGKVDTKTFTITQAGADKEIILSNSDFVVDYQKQTVQIFATLRGISEFNMVSSEISDWATVTVNNAQDLQSSVITVDLSYNSSRFDRSITIVVGNDLINATIHITQKGNVGYEEFPIWKDTIINLDGNTLYRIVDSENKVIYQGRTYGGEIYINRLLRSYVDDNVDIISPIEVGGRFMSNNSYKTFKVQVTYGGDFADYYIVRTYYDYSYENTDNRQLSKPISTILDDRQIFLFTGFNSYKDSSQTLVFQNNPPNPHMSGGITRHFKLDKGIYTYMYDKLIPTQVVVDYSGDAKYFKVKRTCAKYACYYLNKYGGWDSMLFMGRSAKESAVNTTSQFKKDVNNSTKEFQYTDYQRVKKISYKLNTNYLTDAQSAMMHNLLDSNKVYLHNLETGEVFPVTIATNKYEVKTYFNQKRKLYTYTIEFTKSQEQVIR